MTDNALTAVRMAILPTRSRVRSEQEESGALSQLSKRTGRDTESAVATAPFRLAGVAPCPDNDDIDSPDRAAAVNASSSMISFASASAALASGSLDSDAVVGTGWAATELSVLVGGCGRELEI